MALNVVSERVPEEEKPSPSPNPQILMAIQLVMTAVKTFSARAVIAIYNSFAVVMFGVAAYLWYIVLPNISYEHILGLTIFALFTLGMVKLVRKI